MQLLQSNQVKVSGLVYIFLLRRIHKPDQISNNVSYLNQELVLVWISCSCTTPMEYELDSLNSIGTCLCHICGFETFKMLIRCTQWRIPCTHPILKDRLVLSCPFQYFHRFASTKEKNINFVIIACLRTYSSNFFQQYIFKSTISHTFQRWNEWSFQFGIVISFSS